MSVNLTQSIVGTGPYYLSTAGETYVLQENLTFTGSGLVVNANNITIDLNGKTLTFQTSGDRWRYGIVCPPGYAHGNPYWFQSDITSWGHGDNLTITNGTIQQAEVGIGWIDADPVSGAGTTMLSACILSEGGTDITISDVTIHTWGRDTWPIQLMNFTGLADVHDNLIQEYNYQITNRSALHGAITIALAQASGHIHAYNNEIYGSPQTGIVVGGSLQSAGGQNLVYNNIIQHNARVTNCFGIHIYASSGLPDEPIGVYGNNIMTYDADPDGDHDGAFNPAPILMPTRNGRGIACEGGSSYVDITGNIINVCYEPVGGIEHSEYTTAAAALKFEKGVHVNVRNNVATAHGASRYYQEDYNDDVTPAVWEGHIQRSNGIVVAVATANDDAWPQSPNHLLIENNTLVSIEEGGQYYPHGGSDVGAPYSAPFELSEMATGTFVTIQNNDCYSNDRFLVFTGAGHPPNEYPYHVLPDDDFIFNGNSYNIHATGEVATEWGYTQQEPTFVQFGGIGWSVLNPILGPGVGDLRGIDDGWNWNYRAFDVRYDGEVSVKDTSDNPVAGVTIAIRDANEITVFEGITNAAGIALVDGTGVGPRLKDFTRWVGTEAGGVMDQAGLVEHNPHTVVLTVGEYQDTQELTADAPGFAVNFTYDVGTVPTEVISPIGYLNSTKTVIVKGYNFEDGNAVDFNSAYITVNSTTFVDSNTLRASISIANDNAAIGYHDVTVAGGTLTDGFQVRDDSNLLSAIWYPNGKGRHTGLLSSGGAANWNNVEETPASDTDYNYVAVNGNGVTAYDDYHINSTSYTGKINSVTVSGRVRHSGTASDASVASVLRVNSTLHIGAAVSLPSSYELISTTFDYNPVTSLEWTWNDLATLYAGVSFAITSETGNDVEAIVSQLYVTVSYDKYIVIPTPATVALGIPAPERVYQPTHTVYLYPTAVGTYDGTDWQYVGDSLLGSVDETGSPDLDDYIYVAASGAPEVLRPSAAIGAREHINNLTWPSPDESWAALDEITPDDGTTKAYTWIEGTGVRTDRFELTNPVATGAIDSVTVQYRVSGAGLTYATATAGLYIDSVDYWADPVSVLNLDWVTHEYTWATNPATSLAWVAEDLTSLGGVIRSATADGGTVNWTWFAVSVLFSGQTQEGGGSYPVSFQIEDPPTVAIDTKARIVLVEPVVYAKSVTPDPTGNDATITPGVYLGGSIEVAPTASPEAGWNVFSNGGTSIARPGGGEWTWEDIRNAEIYAVAHIDNEILDREIDVASLSLKVTYTTVLYPTGTFATAALGIPTPFILLSSPLDAIAEAAPTGTFAAHDATAVLGTLVAQALGPATIHATAVTPYDPDQYIYPSSWAATFTAYDATGVPGGIVVYPTSVALGLADFSADVSPGEVIATASVAALESIAFDAGGGVGTTGTNGPGESVLTVYAPTIVLGGVSVDAGYATFRAIANTATGSVADIPVISPTTVVFGLTINEPTILNKRLIGVTPAPASGVLRIPIPRVIYDPPSVEEATFTSPFDGIDNEAERNFFEYRPVIRRDISEITAIRDMVLASEIDATSGEAATLPEEDAVFISDIRVLDEKLKELKELIVSQQQGLQLIVDRTKRPDVIEAVIYFKENYDQFSELKVDSATNPVITYPLYDFSKGLLAGVMERQLGGNIHQVKSKDEYETIAALTGMSDSKRVLTFVSRYILGIVLEFIAKKTIPRPLGAFKSNLLKWVGRLKKIKFSPTMNVDDLEDVDNEILEAGTILGDAIGGGTTAVEAIGYANIIVGYVASNVKAGNTPGASPYSFYAEPVYEAAYSSQAMTKILAHTGLSSVSLYRAHTQKALTEEDIAGDKRVYTTDVVETIRLLEKQPPKERVSEAYTKIRDYGVHTAIRATDDMIAALKLWFTTPDVLCCLIKFLGASGKIDKKILYAMRAFLHYRLMRLRGIANEGLGVADIFNIMLTVLMAKLTSSIDSLRFSASGGIDGVINSLSSSDVTSACSPLDEMLCMLKGELITVNVDIRSLVGSLIGQFKQKDNSLKSTSASIYDINRTEMFYELVNAILGALESGKMCATTSDTVVATPTPPSIEEVNEFLDNLGNPLFRDAQRGREYMIQKYQRDPVTGAPISSSSFGTEAEIRTRLQDCGKLQGKALDDVVVILKEWKS